MKESFLGTCLFCFAVYIIKKGTPLNKDTIYVSTTNINCSCATRASVRFKLCLERLMEMGRELSMALPLSTGETGVWGAQKSGEKPLHA